MASRLMERVAKTVHRRGPVEHVNRVRSLNMSLVQTVER
jgi:hypothetical protein